MARFLRAFVVVTAAIALADCTALKPGGDTNDASATDASTDLSPACDADGDGHATPACGGDDCDDANASVFPHAPEVCNGADDDCDGAIDGPAATHACETAPNVATAVCVAGACSSTCTGAFLDCSTTAPGCETNGSSDGLHCGSCGHACTVDPAAGCLPGGLCAGDMRQLAAGGQHTCALRRGGGIGCWGDNGTGELGDGTTTSHLMPTAVGGVVDAIQIAAGDGNTCLLRGSGAVACWGANSDGNLGDGTVLERDLPVDVVGITDVAQVTVGRGHTCARITTGTVYCWGADKFGEVGSGSFPHAECTSHDCALSPNSVTSLGNAIDIAAGDLHTCAALTGGSVVCWGRDGEGQLGNGAGIESSCGGVDCASIPVTVTGVTSAVEVASGIAHSCARAMDGAVVCWGANNAGQLGDGLATHADCGGVDCATAPVTVSGLHDATQITAGGDHTCALRVGGTVVCWGSDVSGQLGDGAATHSSCGGADCALAPVTVVGLMDAVEVAAGQIHTCARRATGEVLCWGDNGSGQLGDGTNVEHEIPTAIIDP